MTKYEQLAKLIEMGMIIRGHDTKVIFTALAHIWNGWSRFQAVIDECEDKVDKMATDYLNFLFAGYPEPEWHKHFGDAG